MPSLCPLCKKPTHKDFPPFCSKQCKMLDLHGWLSESYSIPGEPIMKDPLSAEEEE